MCVGGGGGGGGGGEEGNDIDSYLPREYNIHAT